MNVFKDLVTDVIDDVLSCRMQHEGLRYVTEGIDQQ